LLQRQHKVRLTHVIGTVFDGDIPLVITCNSRNFRAFFDIPFGVLDWSHGGTAVSASIMLDLCSYPAAVIQLHDTANA
jgi:hypothetical protein